MSTVNNEHKYMNEYMWLYDENTAVQVEFKTELGAESSMRS